VSTRFDEFGESYRTAVERSISFVSPDLDFFTRAKAEALLALCRTQLGEPSAVRALDVGCGPGETDALLGVFAELHGVDVSAAQLESARRRNPSVRYRLSDGARLPYADGAFDLAFTICVVHHVPRPARRRFSAELARVVRPGGIAAIVEHNPINPMTRLAVARCAFDDGAELLGPRQARSLLRGAGLTVVHSRYILFFPWETLTLRKLESRFARVPLGAQYIVAARRP
jgi:SAM-dependent methyltransferase